MKSPIPGKKSSLPESPPPVRRGTAGREGAIVLVDRSQQSPASSVSGPLSQSSSLAGSLVSSKVKGMTGNTTKGGGRGKLVAFGTNARQQQQQRQQRPVKQPINSVVAWLNKKNRKKRRNPNGEHSNEDRSSCSSDSDEDDEPSKVSSAARACRKAERGGRPASAEAAAAASTTAAPSQEGERRLNFGDSAARRQLGFDDSSDEEEKMSAGNLNQRMIGVDRGAVVPSAHSLRGRSDATVGGNRTVQPPRRLSVAAAASASVTAAVRKPSRDMADDESSHEDVDADDEAVRPRSRGLLAAVSSSSSAPASSAIQKSADPPKKVKAKRSGLYHPMFDGLESSDDDANDNDTSANSSAPSSSPSHLCNRFNQSHATENSQGEGTACHGAKEDESGRLVMRPLDDCGADGGDDTGVGDRIPHPLPALMTARKRSSCSSSARSLENPRRSVEDSGSVEQQKPPSGPSEILTAAAGEQILASRRAATELRWTSDEDDISPPPAATKRPRTGNANGSKAKAGMGGDSHRVGRKEGMLGGEEVGSQAEQAGGQPGQRQVVSRRRIWSRKSVKINDAAGYDDNDDDDHDDDSIKGSPVRELHPHFENPNFGPFEEEPLHLGCVECNQGCVRYEVPPSINRYLPDYQKTGIKFMFDRCIQGKGCILGDDMGLGKTIQVVSLLAALLQKTGTRQDLRELRRRKTFVKHRLRMDCGVDAASEPEVPDWCPVLVIVPVSIVDNWVKAFQTWGHFAVEVLDNETNVENFNGGVSEVLICKHSLIMMEAYVRTLTKVNWRLVVVDEIHNFKNHKARLSTHFRELRKEVELRTERVDMVVVGLTGTLMQNNHKEFWNVIHLVQPDLLGSWNAFQNRFANPIKMAEKRGADAGTRERGNIASGLLNEKILPDIYLRRPKLILDLPAKDEIIVFCELSSTQKDIYEHILEQPDFVLLKQANGPCDCAANNEVFREYKRRTTMEQKIYYVRQNKDKIVRRCRCHYRCPWDYSSSDGIAVNAVLWREKHQSLSGELAQCENCPWCISLPALALLNRLVSHVSLLQAKENPDRWSPWAREYAKAMRELAHAKGFLPSEMVAENKIPGGYFRDDSLMSYENYCELSGKLRVLGRLLKRIYHKQGRALVFSAYTTVLDVIQRFLLTLPGLETYEYRRVDGSTPLKERNRLVDEFNNNPNILAFLLSTRAMGQGVNLTAANNVIIFDVEWNPANDAQAQDRAYRIGQTADVKIYRLVARGTVEELKYLRQIYKIQLKDQTIKSSESHLVDQPSKREFHGVADDQENKGELFGMANLLKFRDGTFVTYQGETSSEVGFKDIEAAAREKKNELASVLEDIPVAAMDKLIYEISDSDGDEAQFYEDYGGESQVNIRLFERVEVNVDAMSAVPEAMSSRGDSSPYPAVATALRSRAVVKSSDDAQSTVAAKEQPLPLSMPRLATNRSFHIHLPKSKERKVVNPTVNQT